jgi:hypothetical protein
VTSWVVAFEIAFSNQCKLYQCRSFDLIASQEYLGVICAGNSNNLK